MEFNQNLLYGKERYGAVPEAPSPDRAMRLAKALMVIVGADGEVSGAEMTALRELGTLMGFPAAVIKELEGFDYRHAKLEDLLRGLTDSSHARRVLYDAIRVSHADGYAKQEHQSAMKAAQLLGIDRSVVVAIEGMVEVELAMAASRARLLTTDEK
jgi:tellurite resistance protein